MLLPHVVTTLRGPLTADGKGNLIHDWPHAVVGGPWSAFVQPATSTELTLNQDQVVSRWRIYTEAAADIVATDRIVWNGLTFFVDGEIQAWNVGEGVHHKEGLLQRLAVGGS